MDPCLSGRGKVSAQGPCSSELIWPGNLTAWPQSIEQPLSLRIKASQARPDRVEHGVGYALIFGTNCTTAPILLPLQETPSKFDEEER